LAGKRARPLRTNWLIVGIIVAFQKNRDGPSAKNGRPAQFEEAGF
jgi:hypothetical protein